MEALPRNVFLSRISHHRPPIAVSWRKDLVALPIGIVAGVADSNRRGSDDGAYGANRADAPYSPGLCFQSSVVTLGLSHSHTEPTRHRGPPPGVETLHVRQSNVAGGARAFIRTSIRVGAKLVIVTGPELLTFAPRAYRAVLRVANVDGKKSCTWHNWFWHQEVSIQTIFAQRGSLDAY